MRKFAAQIYDSAMKSKNIIIAIAAMTLLTATPQQAEAQTRKRTTTAKNAVRRTQTAVTSRTNNTASTPKATINTIAAYYFKPKKVYVGKDYIFYLEDGKNNAVMGIDQNTGETVTFVPGIANVYEEARPAYNDLQAGGNYLFCGLGYDNNSEYHVYDVATKELKTVMKDWMNIDAINDRHALVWTKKGHKELWDITQLKRITAFPRDVNWGSSFKQKFYIASDGAIWFQFQGINRIDKSGRATVYSLANEAYMVKNNVKEINHVAKHGDSLYVSAKRRIYLMNMLQPGKWEEYAKVPLTEDNFFNTFVPDSKGNLLTSGDSFHNRSNNCIEYYRVGAFDTPKPMGYYITTGLTEWGYKEIGIGGMLTDKNDNYIKLEDSCRLFIYNPNGVKGYAKAKGKVVKLAQ